MNKEDYERAFEQCFKENVKAETERMMRIFSFEENMNIAYIPLVLTTMSFEYLHKVLYECGIHKIKATVELCKAARKVEEGYWNFIHKDLDPLKVLAVKRETKRFMESISTDLTIMWCSVKNEFTRVFPNVAYDKMRTAAFLSRMMIEILRDHQERMNTLISQKMHDSSRVVENPYVTKLYIILDAFIGDCNLEYSTNMINSIRIFKNKMNKIEFDIVA